MWLPFTPTSVFYESSTTTDDADPVYYCVASNTAAFLSFITQFSLIASQLCFLVISVDLRNAYTNPFSSYQQNRFYFAAFVIGFSAMTGVSLMFMGPRVYGVSTEGTVWIQDRRANASLVWPKALLFYVFLAIIYPYSLWANFQYYYQTKDSTFSNSFKHRFSIMERSKKYTFGYVLYESITLLCEFISFFITDSLFVSSMPSYFYCFQGLWDLTVILYSNWSEITWENINPLGKQNGEITIADVAQEGLRLHPHLNTALRAEILYFTTQGIMFASRQLQDNAETIPVESSLVKTFLEYEKSILPITFSLENVLTG